MQLRSPTIPLLLTSSAIAYDTGVALANTQARIQLTLESIAEWIKIAPNLKIVICDGSNFDFSERVKTRFPAAAIECLYFENDQRLVQQHGRGYGEGEIVRYATANSKFLLQAGCFAKCTSKLWISNFAECLSQWNGRLLLKGVFDNALTRTPHFAYIDTRFYVASIPFYNAHFADAHNAIEKITGYGLEQSFLAILLEKKIERVLLRSYPVVEGVGGGTGKRYRNSLFRLFKESVKLFLLRRNPRFAGLFTAPI